MLLDALDKLSGKRSNLRFAEIVMHSPDVGSNRFRQVMMAIKGSAPVKRSTHPPRIEPSAFQVGFRAKKPAALRPYFLASRRSM